MTTVYDIVRAITLIFGIGYTARQNRKTWMWGESMLWGCYALGTYLFPRSLFPGNESDVLAYLVRNFAAWIVGMESMWYLSRRTRSENVVGSLLWSRFMGSLTLILVLAYFYSQNADKLLSKTLYFDVLGFALLLLSTVYQLWHGDYRVGGREQKGHLSTIFRLNFLILFFSGLTFLAYPSWVVPMKIDAFGALMVRCVGALLFGISFTAWYAPSFRNDDDCNAFFLSQILAMSMVFVNLNISYFFDNLFTSKEALMLHLGCLPALLLVLGLYVITQNGDRNQTAYNLRSKSE